MIAPALCIPYRGTTVDRRVAFKYVAETLQAWFPDSPLIVGDVAGDKFSRAGSRNAAVTEAVGVAGASVVIVCDADTLPERSALYEAVEAATDGRMHLPYTKFMSLSREATLDMVYLDGDPLSYTPEFTSDTSVGGCFVMLADSYYEVGCQDTGFVGWGGEDVAFAFACETFLGENIRHTGNAVGLYHPTDMRRGTVEYNRMIQRQDKYRRARGNPIAMRSLTG